VRCKTLLLLCVLDVFELKYKERYLPARCRKCSYACRMSKEMIHVKVALALLL
jgi:hypothetical protein